ncbi:MAG TPA: DUF4328 domain-containing protein [Polyangia bacterium]|jgi:hypothetical protein|nr:DUF4328 domain-containing protein [Polyangia bacterium]
MSSSPSPDPYAPPTTDVDAGARDEPRGDARYRYRALSDGLLYLKIAFGLFIVLSLVRIAFCASQYELLERIQLSRIGAGSFTQEEALANDVRMRASAALQVLLQVIVAVRFLQLVAQANRNLRALGVTQVETTPGWAVGSFFVPFMNLVWPYRVMQELWWGSETRETPRQLRNGPLLIQLWWGCYIGMNVISVYSAQVGNRSSIDSLETSTLFVLVSEIASVAAAVLALLMMLRLAGRQEAKRQAIAAAPALSS